MYILEVEGIIVTFPANASVELTISIAYFSYNPWRDLALCITKYLS